MRCHPQPTVKDNDHHWADPLHAAASMAGSIQWRQGHLAMLRIRLTRINWHTRQVKQDKTLLQQGLGLGRNIFAILWQVCITRPLPNTSMIEILQGPIAVNHPPQLARYLMLDLETLDCLPDAVRIDMAPNLTNASATILPLSLERPLRLSSSADCLRTFPTIRPFG